MVKVNIGLFFGSFNPIHSGHMMLANYMIEYTELDELWFVVSPQNPLKEKKTLLSDFQRFEMVSLAIANDERFTASDIEFRMPKPSYTINTLTLLSERHSNYRFFLICGMDSLSSFPKWKNYEQILANYTLLVYPRKGYETNELTNHSSVKIVYAPEIEISSSFIRRAISEKKDMRHFMPERAYKYMIDMHFYEK